MAASIVDDELKCGICLELFQDPRSLPCLHTFLSGVYTALAEREPLAEMSLVPR